MLGSATEEEIRETSSLFLPIVGISGSVPSSSKFQDCKIIFNNQNSYNIQLSSHFSLFCFLPSKEDLLKRYNVKEQKQLQEIKQAKEELEKIKSLIPQLRFHPGYKDEHLGSGYDNSSDYDFYTCCNAKNNWPVHREIFTYGCTYSSPILSLLSYGITGAGQWQGLKTREAELTKGILQLQQKLSCRRCGSLSHLAPDCKRSGCRWCLSSLHLGYNCTMVECSRCNSKGHIAAICFKVPCAHCLSFANHSPYNPNSYCEFSTCTKCNATGHATHLCSTSLCSWCNKWHLNAEVACPNHICGRCKVIGHPASHCSAPECALCHQIGHDRKRCPQKATILEKQQKEKQVEKEKAKAQRLMAKEERQAKLQVELAKKEKQKQERESRKQEKEAKQIDREKQKETRALESRKKKTATNEE